MNHSYFLAYTATSMHTIRTGYRVFEIPIGTSGRDIVAIMEGNLDQIRDESGSNFTIIATAFNKI